MKFGQHFLYGKKLNMNSLHESYKIEGKKSWYQALCKFLKTRDGRGQEGVLEGFVDNQFCLIYWGSQPTTILRNSLSFRVDFFLKLGAPWKSGGGPYLSWMGRKGGRLPAIMTSCALALMCVQVGKNRILESKTWAAIRVLADIVF